MEDWSQEHRNQGTEGESAPMQHSSRCCCCARLRNRGNSGAESKCTHVNNSNCVHACVVFCVCSIQFSLLLRHRSSMDRICIGVTRDACMHSYKKSAFGIIRQLPLNTNKRRRHQHMNTNTLNHTYIHSYTHTHTHTYMHTNSYTHAHFHEHLRTRK